MKKLAMLFLLAVLPAAAQNPATANITAQDSGTCATAGACLTINVTSSAASSVVQVTGTFSATLQFEGATNQSGVLTFVAVNAVPVGGSTAVTSTTSTGAWRIAVAGLSQVRVRCSTFSSGPAVVSMTLSTGSSANNTAGGGTGAVSSVFTRTGAVTAQSGDYTCAQVTNCVPSGSAIDVSQPPYSMNPGYQIYDAAIASGSPNVTSTGFTFTSAMIGWLAHYTNCSASPCLGAVYEFPLNSSAENTITGCSPSCPSHVAILTQNASATVAAGAGIFTFAPNNDAGWTALESALNSYSTTPNCPTLVFSGGYYMTRKGRFNVVTCLNPAWNTSFTSGQDRQLTIAGLGEPGNAYIEPTQDFDFTTGSGNSCGGGVSNNTCFGGAQGTRWMNAGVDGGGASLTGGSHSVNVIETTNDSFLFQFYCTNWGASDSAMVGWKGSSGSQPNGFTQLVGCGKNPFVAATGITELSNSFVGGTTGTVVTVNSGATFFSSQNGMGYISTCPANVVQWDITGTMNDSMSDTGSCSGVNNTGIKVENGGAFVGYRTNATIGGTGSSSALTINNGTAICGSCVFNAVSGFGVNVTGGTTGVFLSTGANGITGGTNSVATSATAGTAILQSTDVLSGALFTPLTCTFTTGGGTSPSCSMQSGSLAEHGVIIASTGTGSPGTTGTVTLNLQQRTYTVNGNTPVCRFWPDDSGTTWGNMAVTRTSVESSTAPVAAWSNSVGGTLTALATSSPYRIGYECVAR